MVWEFRVYGGSVSESFNSLTCLGLRDIQGICLKLGSLFYTYASRPNKIANRFCPTFGVLMFSVCLTYSELTTPCRLAKNLWASAAPKRVLTCGTSIIPARPQPLNRNPLASKPGKMMRAATHRYQHAKD